VAVKPLEEHEIWLRDQARSYQAERSDAGVQADVEAGMEPTSESSASHTPVATPSSRDRQVWRS